MAGQDPWSEFETYRHSIKYSNTVDKLKQILQGLNEECGTHITKSGKKQEIIDRIVSLFDGWKQSNMTERWNKAKVVLDQVRTTGTYNPGRPSGSSMQTTSSSISSGGYASTSYTKGPGYSSPTTSRYDPYARKNSTVLSSAASSSSIAKPPTAAARNTIQWKESPFFQIDQTVSTLVECPETTSATDRKQQTLTFNLTSEQVEKLKRPSTSFRTYTAPCPIEFPPTCEVRVNNVVLTASLKGLKKKAGTAPPPDLGKYVRIGTTQNRIEMVYVNSQQPTQPKKFYLIVVLVENTTVDTLVQNLKQTRFRSTAEVLKQVQASAPDDDDIIAGPQKMSLKCPLSFMRINTPCRSEKCTHRQCFDATSWFSVMEQTTTYLCPICERALSWKDLIIDGSFDDILKSCPDSVEDVMVEADGEWHTSDNKYGSVNWKIKHPPTGAKKVTSPPRQQASPVKAEAYEPHLSLKLDTEKKLSNGVHQIMVLDSDDEDEEGTVRKQLSPSSGNGTSASSRAPPTQEEVIDLTLDSDEEEEAVPPKQTGKRKASDAALSPTEPIWKKGRTEAADHASSYRTSNATNHDPGRGYPYSSTHSVSSTYNARNQTSPNGSSYTSRGPW
ncbi:E3 SUMO-protein ligase pli1 [Marasmius crinis-equi]|uniref:E3 SUMO-protein ligase pli1 n=1 Tax=Marasmius crinis-equi TaxID=585013 RepID=A0ABR3FMA3_9AGAR